MSKRKFDETDVRDQSQIHAYVHTVSPVKQAMYGSTRYFDGYLQTSETELVRFVSFSPEKVDSFQSAEHMKSPVIISNVTVKPVLGGKEVTVSRSSNIEISKKKLFFDPKSRIPETTAPEMPLNTITAPNIPCSVKVKMSGFMDEEQTKATRFGPRKLRTAVLADSSQVIKLPLWEGNIFKVKSDCFYKITNLVSANFNGEIQLNTTQKTSFLEIEAFGRIYEDMSKLLEMSTFRGSVKLSRVSSQSKCLNCQKPLTIETGAPLIKCIHCQSKQKTADLVSSRTLHLQLENEEGLLKKFVVFTDVLQSYLEKNSLTKYTDSELEDHILLSPVVEINHQNSSDVATSIE